MANTNNANGFLPAMNPNNGSGQPIKTYFDLSSTNTEIGIGTPVTSSSGVIDIATAGTGNPLIGIAAEYKAANSGGKIAVWADPNQYFVAQTDDGTGTATSVAAAQANCNFIGTGVSNGRSTSELDESSATTGATLQFKLLFLEKSSSNAYGEFNRWVVKINNHQLGSHTGTAGT
jgi:hypothetical protein